MNRKVSKALVVANPFLGIACLSANLPKLQLSAQVLADEVKLDIHGFMKHMLEGFLLPMPRDAHQTKASKAGWESGMEGRME